MNSLYPLLAFPGLMAGLQVWIRIVHSMAMLIGISSSTNPVPAVSVAFHRQVLLLGILVGAWVLVFVGLTYYVNGHADSPGWSWFFGGVAATPAVVIPSGVRTWLRAQRRRA